MGALRFESPEPGLLAGLSERDWKHALAFSDRAQLTLALGLACNAHLPDWVRERIHRDLRNNAARWDRVRAAYTEVASAFENAGLEFAVLKGFSHCPRFTPNPRHRWQGDIDLFLPEEQALRAYDVARELTYEPIVPGDRHAIDHLPTLIRRTGWEWKGDYFDVDLPLALELHFRFWDQQTERFAPHGLEQFWERRVAANVDGLQFVALHPADAMANSCLHLLRHLLRGSVRPSHVYELASLLHHGAGDISLWSEWPGLHHPSLRRLEAICFSIAQKWFDCVLPAPVLEEVEALPAEMKRWLDIFSISPLAGHFRPNKDELWLHWSLLDSPGARSAVLRRRLIPERLPGPVDAVHLPEEQRTLRIRLRSRWRYLVFLTSRVAHHLRALPPTAASAARWFGGSLELDARFWRFFVAEGFFDFGMFVFVFLYNLYLLQLGFRENFIGVVSGVMTAGTLAGSIPAALAAERFGIRRTLMASFALTAGISALRAYLTAPPALLALAAAAGLVSSAWPVALAPLVASVTTPKNRPVGFSLVCSSGIAIGILGGLAAGNLPAWFSGLRGISSIVASYRAALFAGCAIVMLAVWPLSRIRTAAAPPREQRKLYRPSPLVTRFLVAMLVWSLGTGFFNPFTNVFFAQHIHLPVRQIGLVFSWGQFAQVGAVLLAPVVFRRFGVARGISGMEFATAIALLGLAAVRGPMWAALGYVAFMMAQYMSEPGMFTFLMEGVPEAQRSSASALNMLALFAGQAVAAAISGGLIARFGYPAVLAAAAVICAAAALLFRGLVTAPRPRSASSP
jgi:predicted MFS family arabinose efflux permease